MTAFASLKLSSYKGGKANLYRSYRKIEYGKILYLAARGLEDIFVTVYYIF